MKRAAENVMLVGIVSVDFPYIFGIPILVIKRAGFSPALFCGLDLTWLIIEVNICPKW